MHTIIPALIAWITSTFQSRATMQLEILALRDHLGVYRRSSKRPRIRFGDRMLGSWLARVWSGWQDAAVKEVAISSDFLTERA